ncbi:MAG: hypothetical protein KGL39_21265 [Patescibacteria group bacterium]|nr:hypothetical protein [Patescibacteria group bacterium]
MSNTNWIAGQSSANSAGAGDALLLLSGTSLYQINPASLLTNAYGLGPALTNWQPVASLSNSDTLVMFSGSSNRLASVTWSNIVSSIQSNALIVTTSKLPLVYTVTNASALSLSSQLVASPPFPGPPDLVVATINCNSTDLGVFTAGTEINVESVHYGNPATNVFSVFRGPGASASVIQVGSVGGVSFVVPDGGSGQQTLTASKWNLELHCIYFPR